MYSDVDGYCPQCGRAEAPDSIVEKNRQMLLERSKVGVLKYGVTVADNPLPLREWVQHALEEALDMANYLQRIIMEIDNGSGETSTNK